MQETTASGPAVIGVPGENGFGQLQAGFELSNVAVVEEMVNLIAAQRAFESGKVRPSGVGPDASRAGSVEVMMRTLITLILLLATAPAIAGTVCSHVGEHCQCARDSPRRCRSPPRL